MPDHETEGRERDGTAGREKTDVTDFHQAIGQDMLEEAADTLDGVEVGRTWSGAAHFTGGERHRALLEAHDAAVGESDPEDRGGEGGAGGVAGVVGVAMDRPGESPSLRIDLFQQTGLAHVCLEERAVERGEGFDRDKEVGAGGHPRCAVRGEAPARDDRVEVGVVLELPAPGVQNTGAPWQVGANDPRGGGEPFESERRGVEHGVGGKALMRADAGAERLRDREGAEAVRPGKLLLEVVCEPWLGCRLLTLGAVPVAAGMMDTVVPPTGWARIEAVAVGAALAVWEGVDDCAVRGGEGGL